MDDGGESALEPLLSDGAGVAGQIRLIRRDHEGPAAARNAGLAAAAGEYVVFTDDDCCPEPGWLEEFDRAFRLNPRAAIGGLTENSLRDNSFAAASQALIDYLYQTQDGNTGSAFFTSNNLAFPVVALRRIGGFDAVSFPRAGGEDRDICERWSRQGGELLFQRSAIVAHYHDLRLRTFWGQHFRYGRGAFQFHRNRVASGGARRQLERVEFYAGMFSYPFARKLPNSIAVSALMMVSQVANGAGYFAEKFAARRVRPNGWRGTPPGVKAMGPGAD